MICKADRYEFLMSVAKKSLKKIVYEKACDGLTRQEKSYRLVANSTEWQSLENAKNVEWYKCSKFGGKYQVYEWKGNNDQIAYCRVEWDVKMEEGKFRKRLFFKRVEE